MQQAILGAGCFWGVESIFKRVEGILNTQVGYLGGMTTKPTYQDISTGKTGHAEVLKVEFNEEVITYKEILDLFFRMHDPTQLDRQHGDIGTQYRSAIFFIDDGQKQIAKDFVTFLNDGDFFRDPVVTKIEFATKMYPAEDYHQDYLEKNPGGYMCHLLRPEFSF
jgi:methionine-S-sulfoxide reductase